MQQHKRDPFDYPVSTHLPPEFQSAIKTHRKAFSELLRLLYKLYPVTRYNSLVKQHLEAAESLVSKGVEFDGINPTNQKEIG